MRPERFASRASARRPAASSAVAASCASSSGGAAVELGEQRRGLVEVVRADLEQLLAGPLLEPLGELACSSARCDFEIPEYATSRISTCLKR